MSAVDQTSAEEQLDKARVLLDEVVLPPEVTRIDLNPGTDLAGQPALWVLVHIRQDVQPSREQVKRLTQFTRELQSRLINAGVTLFPYTSLEQAA